MYIEINGKNSKEVEGLLITDLPPIIKPALKYKEESVDGRDGGRIIPLGYKSYAKKFKVGLVDGHNVDEVVEYLNQSGEIVFSNEPDKVYKFHALKAIQFDELLKFKKAKLEYLVQPFKHKKNEAPQVFRGSGIIINEGNTDARPLIYLEGVGILDVKVNDELLLEADLKDGGGIYIDTEKLEAYDSHKLRNRDVDGDYNLVRLKPGKNSIAVAGDCNLVGVTQYSRWL